MLNKDLVVRLLKERIKYFRKQSVPYEKIPDLIGFDTETSKNVVKGNFDAIDEMIEFMRDKNIPLEFVKTVNEAHYGDKPLLLVAIASAITPWTNTETVNIHIVGSSSSGKTHALGSILKTIVPPTHYASITSNSPKAIYYAARKGMLNRNLIIMLDDLDTYDSFVQKLKTLTWTHTLKPRHWTVIGGKFEEMSIENNFAFWLTSVHPPKNEELQNRFIYLNTDESEGHKLRVYERVKKLFSSGKEKQPVAKRKIDLMRNIFNLLTLEQTNVVIPFDIDYEPKSDVRSVVQFFALLKGITALNKHKRRRTKNGCIVASYSDCLLAKEVATYINPYKMTSSLMKLWNILPREEGKTKYEIANALGVSTRTVIRGINQLSRKDLIQFGFVGKVATYKKKIDTIKSRITIKTPKKFKCDISDYETIVKYINNRTNN